MSSFASPDGGGLSASLRPAHPQARHLDDEATSNGQSKSSTRVSDLFKALGYRIAQIVRQDGQYLSPLLASFTARCITLETTGRYPVEDLTGAGTIVSLTPEQEEELIRLTIDRALSQDDPLYETIKMQITFEGFYAMELQRLRNKRILEEEKNGSMLDNIVQVGTNLVSSTQVATLYRLIFKLLLANGCIDESQHDLNVDREIAVALESVFPQAGLNAFNLMSAEKKRHQLTNLIYVVLGIRLFNKEIRRGGAGLADIPKLVSSEIEQLYERLTTESQTMSDVCFTLADLITLEYQRPGTLFSNLRRLQDELTNRRQYVLFLNQLQYEVLESLDVVKDNKAALEDEFAQLRGIVGVRTQVPKEQVYPIFHRIAKIWHALIAEREKNALRAALFTQLTQFRDSFTASRVDEDLPSLKYLQVEPAPTSGAEFDSFVTTVHDDDGSIVAGSETDSDHVPVRLIKETTQNFMSLPLEYQGYCPWTIVMRAGLLIPADPNLGIIRYRKRHYGFTSINAMRDFCRDPTKFLDGVILTARRVPCLIHLLGLQPFIPNSDISEFFTMADFIDHRNSALASAAHKVDASTQLGVGEYVNTDLPDPNYEWNEWVLRKKALQMADLLNMRTVSTQTVASHFRRDAATQTTIKPLNKDGTAPGVGTQTGIEKGTQVERVVRHHFGLRGKRGAHYFEVSVNTPATVTEGTNSDLRAIAARLVGKPSLYDPDSNGGNQGTADAGIQTQSSAGSR